VGHAGATTGRFAATEGDALKFGISYNTGYHGADPDQMIAVARQAEDCGFESFHVSVFAGRHGLG
jgi:hypothetical protein